MYSHKLCKNRKNISVMNHCCSVVVFAFLDVFFIHIVLRFFHFDLVQLLLC